MEPDRTDSGLRSEVRLGSAGAATVSGCSVINWMSCGAADVTNRCEESRSWEQRARDAARWLSGNRPERAKLTAMVCGNV